MYLKRLEIQGFKSFANKTTLEFLPPKNGIFSITGIVGPNGAGKSNVTDAIRWVMGEQALKHVRVKKSEDVIFNGSELKAALSAAEVTMVLDNVGQRSASSSVDDKAHSYAKEETEGALAFDGINFSEIVITRRLYRSGESEYIVNNQPARLLDIHLLLAKAQFAEHAYSIVSQGMIDRLLTVSPTERKDFFDEASGIKEHQIKQHQASLKLARTEENIRQAEILLQEVEPRLRVLAKQVKKLEKRQEVEADLTIAQEQYYLTIYTQNKIEVETIKNNLRAVDADYRDKFEKLESIQSELAALARGSSRQEIFHELQTRHQAANKTINDLERQLAIIEGQMHTEYSHVGAHNIGWLEKKISDVRHISEQLAHQAEVSERESRERELSANKQKNNLEQILAQETQLKLKISRLQSELFKDQSEQQYLHLSGLTAVKAVLDAGKKFGKIYGLVAELGTAAPEYGLALEVAAGSHLSSIVVEDEGVARKAIEHLRVNKFGVASFLPLNRIEMRAYNTSFPMSEPGVIGKAIDLVTFDPKFHNIFSLVLGSTLVVENLSVAQRIGIGRARMVTLDGDIVEQKGIIRGGYRVRRNGLSFSSKLSLSNNDHLSEIQAEINLLNHTLSDLQQSIEHSKVSQMEIIVATQSAAEKVKLLENERRVTLLELAGLENELQLIKSSPAEYSQKLKNLASEKESLQQKLISNQDAARQIEIGIEQFNIEEEKKKQRVFQLQEEMQTAQLTVNGILNQRNELNIQLAKVETKQEDLAKEALNDMKVSLEMLVTRVGASNVGAIHELPLQQLADTIQKLKYQLSLIGGIDEEVVKEFSETKERYDFLTSQLDDLSKATADLKIMIAELDEMMKKKRSLAFKKIRKEFDRYFQILFDGGKADLQEVYASPAEALAGEGGEISEEEKAAFATDVASAPKDKILTGIDIIANPPGKKVKYLNMLSGGERTLTSIALICAILYHNPSPFVVLDEVEAALDEANTLRFVKIMGELSTRSQFIIVTHNRVTMHSASALYGVVMSGDGVSQLLSVKMEEAGKYSHEAAVSTQNRNVLPPPI